MNTSPPQPPGLPLLGHLWQWTSDPLALLRAGATAGPVFGLRLWRPAMVGFRPDWNRAVLNDLSTFRSQGSLSALSPYLAAGVVHTDAPQHADRRRRLNRHFSARALSSIEERLRVVVEANRPVGTFEALAWSGRVVRRMLNAALFAGQLPDRLLASYLAPLHRRIPAPMLPRPVLFRRLDEAVAAALARPAAGGIAGHLRAHQGAAEELRVALAAGYDTTAHTLAWAVWHLAAERQWRDTASLPPFLDEVLRLYPAGWLGSRVAADDTEAVGVPVPAGTLVMYSPYLTHRDPDLWSHPGAFRPQRFADGRPAWGYLPFAAGPRTCLGAQLARRMLSTALAQLCTGELERVSGDPRTRVGITLRPHGPLVLRRSGRARSESGSVSAIG